MPGGTIRAVPGQGYGTDIRVFWPNLKLDGTTAIYSSVATGNYVQIGDVVCWNPNVANPEDPTGKFTMCVSQPETRNLQAFAGIVTEVPGPTFGNTLSPVGFATGWIMIRSWYIGDYLPVRSRVDLSGAGTTTVVAGIIAGSSAIAAPVALAADAASSSKHFQIIGLAMKNGTNNSAATEANRALDAVGILLHGAAGK